jgi:predicted nucleic-acid-binding Zn-ribbon protein
VEFSIIPAYDSSMKNSTQCPKCQHHDILRIEGQVGAHGAGNNIGVSFFGAVTVTRYVCTSCGFSEEWIDDPDSLTKLEKKFG